MGVLRALLAAFAALAVEVGAVFFQHGDKGTDKFVDIRFLFFQDRLVVVEAVAAHHIHNRHIGYGFIGVVRALDPHDGRNVRVPESL